MRRGEGGGESEKQREDVQMGPGMSRWIWVEPRGGGGCGGEGGSPDEQIRRNVGGGA